LAVIFAAMALGTKYTSMMFLFSSTISLIGFLVISNNRSFFRSLRLLVSDKLALHKFKTKYFRELFISALLGIVFGGYWYIKNLIISGNPIFPFMFKCWDGILQCPQTSDFFSSWTTPFTLGNIELLKLSLFQTPQLFQLSVVAMTISLFLSFLFKNRKLLLISTFIPFTIISEILISHNFVGFELRYFSHWILLIPILISLPFGAFSVKYLKDKSRFEKSVVVVLSLYFVVMLFNIALPQSIKGIQYFNKLESLSDNDRWMARGKMSFVDWLHPFMPHMYPLITWCGEDRESHTTFVTADPKLMYWTEGLMKVFLVNCSMNFVKDVYTVTEANVSTVVDEYIRNNPNILIASSLTCIESKEAENAHYIKSHPYMKGYILFNTELICRSKEVQPRIYVIDQ
jgi:hypothetical protein